MVCMPDIYVITKVVPLLQMSHEDHVSYRAVILLLSIVQQHMRNRKLKSWFLLPTHNHILPEGKGGGREIPSFRLPLRGGYD